MIGMRNAIVVAHPDDECLFAASMPILYPDRNWTIICLSIPVRDPIRAWKFFNACAMLGAQGRLMPVPEFAPLDFDLSCFDTVVTHNAAGEYGHAHHKQTHAIVTQKRPDAITFGYRADGLGTVQHYLRGEALARKQRAIDCYDHVLPYDGKRMTKAEALRVRYGSAWDFSLETFDVAI